MKKNVIAFLGKEGYKISDLQNDNSNFDNYYHPEFGSDNMVLSISKSNGTPDWAQLFQDYDLNPDTVNQSSLKGALFVNVGNHYLVFTFGHGRSLINKRSIERGFGLRVAMNLGDPEQLKSIDKSTLERVALNTRAQVSVNSGIQDFSFEFDHEILKSVTAIIERGDDELEMVSGKDSVSLYTDIEFDKFENVARRLLEAYFSENYKVKYPWAEYIRVEVDPLIIGNLEDLLIHKLNNRQDDDFWLAPPSIINYEDFSGFVYNKKKRKNNTICKHPQLDLNAFLSESSFKDSKSISLAALRKKSILLLNGDNQVIDEIPFFEALNGEIEFLGHKYVVNDGSWYQISKDFAEEVELYFDRLPRWDGMSSLVYKDKRECCYLRRVADGEHIAVLDQHWVRHKNVKQNYEFCDLFTQCNRMIHVKHYGGSSVLSHLFAQASNGVDMLLNCPEITPQVQEHLDDTYLTFDFNPKGERIHKVVLAIIQERDGPLHIPFLSKVNLRHHARNITNRGFDVELAKISVDKEAAAVSISEDKCSCQSVSCEFMKDELYAK